jgi:uncharacterized protein (DUF1330 family)
MPAYMIGDVREIFDLDRFRSYNRANPETILGRGGRFIVRGGEARVIEGDWTPGRIVVLEFASMEALEGWYDSPEYRAVRPMRHESARSNIIFVEGAQDDQGTGGIA